MKLKTNEFKRCQKKNLIKVLKTGQKSINTNRPTQFALRILQTWLQQSEFVEAEKKPIEV